jgi:hypothetical protein
MSQGSLTIANQSFPAFRTSLNSALQAINTTQSGTSRPSGAVAGTIWLDTTSATSPTLKFYDGADDISLATINYTANTVDWLDSSVTITGLSTSATGTVLTLTDSAHTTSVNMICGNNTALRFNELTANGSNYIGLKAPASLSADLTFTLPSTDGTAGQFLKTDGSGNLSFATAGLTGATSTATGTVLTLSDTQNVAAVNVILDNEKELRFRENTTNGTNYIGFKAPTSLTVDKTYTLPSADGTSGQVLQTNGSGVLSFSSVSSDYVLLETTTVSSAVASVTVGSGLLTSSYKFYIIYGIAMTPSSNGAGGNIRIRTSGGQQTSSYQFYRTWGYSGSATLTGVASTSASQMTWVLGQSISSTHGISFVSYLPNPSNTSIYKTIKTHQQGFDLTPNISHNDSTGCWSGGTDAITGIDYYWDTGNISGGIFKLYGVK